MLFGIFEKFLKREEIQQNESEDKNHEKLVEKKASEDLKDLGLNFDYLKKKKKANA